MTIADVFDLISKGGALAVLVIILYGVTFKRWWVPYWFYEKEVERTERAERLLDRSTGVTDQAIEVAKKVVE